MEKEKQSQKIEAPDGTVDDAIYICFGDSPTQSAVVQWDGISPVDLNDG